MKRIVTISSRALTAAFFVMMMKQKIHSQIIPPVAYSSGIKVSYVRTWDAMIPETNPNNITTSSYVQQFRMATQYFDGLGRPLQTVVKQSSLVTGSTANDLVSPAVYDAFGR